MRSFILSPVACLAIPISPHYLINGNYFEEKKRRGIEQIMFVLIFSTILFLRPFQLQEEFREV